MLSFLATVKQKQAPATRGLSPLWKKKNGIWKAFIKIGMTTETVKQDVKQTSALFKGVPVSMERTLPPWWLRFLRSWKRLAQMSAAAQTTLWANYSSGLQWQFKGRRLKAEGKTVQVTGKQGRWSQAPGELNPYFFRNFRFCHFPPLADLNRRNNAIVCLTVNMS